MGYWVYSSHDFSQDHTSSDASLSGRELSGAVHEILFSGRQTRDHNPNPYHGDYSRVHGVTNNINKDNDVLSRRGANGKEDDGYGDLNGLIVFYFLLSLY